MMGWKSATAVATAAAVAVLPAPALAHRYGLEKSLDLAFPIAWDDCRDDADRGWSCLEDTTNVWPEGTHEHSVTVGYSFRQRREPKWPWGHAHYRSCDNGLLRVSPHYGVRFIRRASCG